MLVKVLEFVFKQENERKYAICNFQEAFKLGFKSFDQQRSL